ncbi:MAG: hypothetical protein Q8L01_03395 [Candidatus Woesebacteria bacterium]|nr:hypothetical protein [Candidatus Woesebacteria bacterium]
MTSETLLLIGTLGGASIGAISAIITTIVTKIYEDKKELRRILLDAAITDWKQAHELAIRSGGNKKLFPLDSYLIHHSKILDAILAKKTSKEELEKILDEENGLYKLWVTSSEKTQQELKNIPKNNGT